VSAAADVSNRLYSESLTAETVLNVIDAKKPEGVNVPRLVAC